MNKLIFNPKVHVIASTVIHPESVRIWAADEGLLPFLEDNATPLGKLYAALMAESDSIGEYGLPGSSSIDRLIEFAGRHCYRSWEKGRELDDYMKNIVESLHSSVMRHATISFAISGVSRTLSLELVRHHVGCDVSQESQRYVDGKDIKFVVPPLIIACADTYSNAVKEGFFNQFEQECSNDLSNYLSWQETLRRLLPRLDRTLDVKRVNEAARARLPGCCETRLTWTMNMNAMRNVIAQRGAETADLEIRRLACHFMTCGRELAPAVFEDFESYLADDGFFAVRCRVPKI